MYARPRDTVFLTLCAILVAFAWSGHATAQAIEGLWEVHIPSFRTPGNTTEGPFTEIAYLAVRDGRIGGTFGRHAGNPLNYSERDRGILGALAGHLARGIAFSGQQLSSRFHVPDRKFRRAPASVNEQVNRLNKPEVLSGTVSPDGRTIGATYQWLWIRWRGDTLMETTEVPVRATFRKVALTLTPMARTNGQWREVERPDYGTPFAIELNSDRTLSAARLAVTLDFAFQSARRGYVLTAVDASRSRFRSAPIVFRPPATILGEASMTQRGGELLVTLPFYRYLRASPVPAYPPAIAAIIAPLRNVVIMRTAIIAGAVLLLGAMAAGGVFTVRKLRARRALRMKTVAEGAVDDPPVGTSDLRFTPEPDRGEQTVERDGNGLAGPAIRLRPQWDAGEQTLVADGPVVLNEKVERHG